MSGIVRQARVAFDITIARTNRMGSGVYARRLFEAMQPLMGDRLSQIAFGYATPFTHRKRLRDRAATLAHDLWWTQLATLGAARDCEADVLHMPAMLAPVRSTLPVVVTVHDLAVLRFPEKFRTWHRSCATFFLPRIARCARAIVTGSQATKADLMDLLAVEPERIHVIPYGISDHFRTVSDEDSRLRAVRTKYKLPARYVITVGTIEPRKNLVRLLRAIDQLRRSTKQMRDLQLIHAGPVGWHADDVPRAITELGLADRVRFLGYVPDEDLTVLYQLARASIYPSLFEGFGLPVLEAMASGCPVVTSNCSSMPEVAGDAAVLVDPTSVDSIASGIQRLWVDDDLRAALARRGVANASKYSWDATARRTVRLYDEILTSS